MQVPSALTGAALVLRAAARRIRPDHLGAGAADRRADAGRRPCVAAAARSQTGQVYVWQQVFGSMPVGTGVTPFGQTGANVGQATGLFGSHVGCCAARTGPRTSGPCSSPLASQTQLLSDRDAGQVQVEPGGAGHARRRIGRRRRRPCRCRRGAPPPAAARRRTSARRAVRVRLAAGLLDVGTQMP